jgi:hypothetical protein
MLQDRFTKKKFGNKPALDRSAVMGTPKGRECQFRLQSSDEGNPRIMADSLVRVMFSVSWMERVN